MKKLLVVVDYQKDFVDGSLGFAGAEQLEGPICEKIEAYARSGGDVVFTFDTHEDDYLNTQEGKKLPVPHCILGSEGWQLYGRVRALSVGRTLFFKKTFGCGELYDYLQAHPEYASVDGHQVVFSLRGWSPALHTGFLVSRTTLDTALLALLSLTGLSPSLVYLPR